MPWTYACEWLNRGRKSRWGQGGHVPQNVERGTVIRHAPPQISRQVYAPKLKQESLADTKVSSAP